MNLAYSIFVAVVWFLSIYFNTVLLLVLINKKTNLFQGSDSNEQSPKVSIIVPAFNEEKTIEECILSLKSTDYPADKLEIIIVNDGSKDKTSEIVKRYAGKQIKLIDNKQNKGKASCLNQGIISSSGEFIACMDADSEVSPDIIKKTLPYFENRKVGAVVVTVEVKNPKTFLQKIIEIEYIIGLSLALKALSFFNAVHVTPGPFSIYRKKVFDEVGLFDINNITEDLEIAYRIQKHKYKIECCLTTRVRTITPDTFKGLYRQRKRWYSGALMTVHQHKDMIFRSKFGWFAYVMPYTFILVFLGLCLFIFSSYLGLSRFYRLISQFSLTGYNFLSYLTSYEFDILKFSSLTFFGLTAIMVTIASEVVYLGLSNKSLRGRKTGFFGFVLFFFLYQLFWGASIISVLFGRKIKWR